MPSRAHVTPGAAGPAFGLAGLPRVVLTTVAVVVFSAYSRFHTLPIVNDLLTDIELRDLVG